MQSQPAQTWDKLACIIATGGGIGLIPVAPGTFGSLWGLLIAWGMQTLGWSMTVQLALLVGLWLAGVWICHQAAKALGEKDPGKIVYDEFTSLPLVFVAVPLSLPTALLGFVLFRLFDTVKPWPVRRLEQLPDGWGIMLDDIAAAGYATLVLWGSIQLNGHL